MLIDPETGDAVSLTSTAADEGRVRSDHPLSAVEALAPTYEVLREIGRGGTAIVYLARDRATGDEVAIKVIRPQYVGDDEAFKRLAREARFIARLDHPNVVALRRVLELGHAGIALVMTHVAGRTLKQLIHDSGSLPPARAERVLRDVAGALGAAHALGIVHRDVKPDNIFIDSNGRALLGDFGVARSMGTETLLTLSGVAIGTPTYMAPEQIDGVELDGRGDVYSLGLVGWEMLTGHRPWEGESLYAVLYHQKHHPLPDVREGRPEIPDRLAEVIAGAIEKDPAARWQSTAALVAALDGMAPPRQATSVQPVTSETVQFVRPAAAAIVTPVERPVVAAAVNDSANDSVNDASPVPAPAAQSSREVREAETLAALAELSTSEFAPRRSIVDRLVPRHRFAALAALVLIVVFSLIAGALRGRSRAVSLADGGSTGALSRSAAVPSVAGGDIGPITGGTRSDSASRAVVTGDAPIGVPITAPPVATPPPPAAAAPATRPTVPPIATPTAMPAAVPARALATRVSIVAGGRHTCLLAEDGRAYCWGGNDRGQLGSGSMERLVTPSPVSADLRLTSIAPGLTHSCAIARGGTAWCWGANDRGQLGDGSSTARSAPVRVAGGHTFLHRAAAGASHSCALDLGGAAWCWGADDHGQLGDNETSDRATPSAVAGGHRYANIEAGWDFTCALERDGRASCWGYNASGQLGDGTASDRHAPKPVAGGLSFTAISAGNGHACGVTVAGEAYCWGSNSGGQLGDGTSVLRSRPVRVQTDARFVAIAAGAVHTCAVTADGDAYCWGRNTYGQLGEGGTTDHATPVRVAGGHAFASVRAFGAHTCGATPSGEAFCWGYNLDGQLGDGSRTHRTRPVYVERPSGA